MPNIETAVAWAEQIAADDRHGYSQSHRNGPDYDCSSMVGTALSKAGFDVSEYSTTRNLESQLIKCGFKKCQAPWKRGDIHLAAGHHVTMSTDDSHIVHASQSENGGIDGQTGDQTGREICIRSYYSLPYSNLVHYRYKGNDEPQKPTPQAIKPESAHSFNPKIAGAYHTNDRYKLRVGAGMNKRVILILPTGTGVRNYGYYTGEWYLVKAVVDGCTYTGYVAKEGLTRG
jgi:hypothetical protein|nr:MAG TPA: peptidoglycan hydrolase [Caudoviricetes sp.]